MNPNFRNFALWVIIFLLVLALVTLFQSPAQKTPSADITFSQLLTEVDSGHVRDVTIAGADISGHYKDGRAFVTYAPNDPGLVDTLYKKDVTITARPPSDGNSWLLTLLINGLPLLLFLGVVQCVVVPLVAVLFAIDLIQMGPALLAIVFCATPGIAAVGTLFGAMTVRTRARDLMLALVLFPLLAPTLLAAVVASRELFGGAPLSELTDYFSLMGLFDFVFLTGGVTMFGMLIDE